MIDPVATLPEKWPQKSDSSLSDKTALWRSQSMRKKQGSVALVGSNRFR